MNRDLELDLYERMDSAVEQMRCARTNLNNLASLLPGLDQQPLFKVVELQIVESLTTMTGKDEPPWTLL